MSTFLPVLRPFESSALGQWPDDAGSWPEALRPLDRVNAEAVGDCVVIQHGVLVAKIGNWSKPSSLWSSCIRTWLTLMYLRAFFDGRLSRSFLYEFVNAPEFASWVKTIHVLSRVTNSTGPDDLSWRYSGGDDWPGSQRLLERQTGQSMEENAAGLTADIGARLTWDRDPDDHTLRIDGSPYEMAKLGLLMLREGQWKDRRVFSADLWAKATSGGVEGDGHPKADEGWQVHLIRGGRYDEIGDRPSMAGFGDGYFAAGGTNRSYVVVLPDKNLVVARVRRSGVFLDQFLPGLLSALGL